MAFHRKTQHKFNAKSIEYDGIKFPSQKEGRYYQKLKLLVKSGEVLFFLRQTPLHLPGSTKYVVDFTVFYADGHVEFIDVKGMVTSMFTLKKTQVEALYPIEITVV